MLGLSTRLSGKMFAMKMQCAVEKTCAMMTRLRSSMNHLLALQCCFFRLLGHVNLLREFFRAVAGVRVLLP